jgi:hypothetical protein
MERMRLIASELEKKLRCFRLVSSDTEILQTGHVAVFVRTHSEILADGEAVVLAPSVQTCIDAVAVV